MSIREITKLLIFFIATLITTNAYSQFVKPTGTIGSSSQLIYYYDNSGFDVESYIQVTNDNDTQPVWIHVQIFRNYLDNDVLTTCDERDFVDMLTPNDTHSYFLNFPNIFPKNMGETETTPGESANIDATFTKGFVVITPVVSESDLTAISFQNLTGKTYLADFTPPPLLLPDARYQVEAMGRDAVDFTTGEIVPNGTPLDGVSNGYVVLQPEELLFEFQGLGNVAILAEESINVDIVGIVFNDVYGDPGLLGYQVQPGTASWTSFMFDFKEDPTSCGNRAINCFSTVGLNDTFGLRQNNTDLIPGLASGDGDGDGDSDISGFDLLCSGAETPEYPFMGANFNLQFTNFGWARIFVSGLDDFENHLGFFINANIDGASLIYTKGEETQVTPTSNPEDCAVEGDEDGDGFADCLDTDCATAENCETGDTECGDTLDNDADGQTDCADLGCDGFAGCEFGTETSCDDGIDNDADGQADCNDTDCAAAEACGGGTTGGGGGGGCSVATSVTTATAAANMLLPLLPLFGAYGIRKRRR